MALQFNWNDQATGADHPSAYWRVESVTFSRNAVSLHVLAYQDATCCAAGKAPIHVTQYDVPAEDIAAYFADSIFSAGATPRGQAYLWLLAKMSFFSGATSV